MAGVTGANRDASRITQLPIAQRAQQAVQASTEQATQSPLNGRVASWGHRIFDFKDRILSNISSAVSTVFSGVRGFAGAIRSNARPISLVFVGMGVGAILMVALGILRKNATNPSSGSDGESIDGDAASQKSQNTETEHRDAVEDSNSARSEDDDATLTHDDAAPAVREQDPRTLSPVDSDRAGDGAQPQG